MLRLTHTPTKLATLATLALGLALAGCGGAGGGGSTTLDGSRLAVSVDWDDTTRAPGDAQSVVLTLTAEGLAKAYTKIVNRVPGQSQATAVFEGLPAAEYRLTAEAHAEANGLGSEVAEVATSLDVGEGSAKEAALALVGQIHDIVIPDLPDHPAPNVPIDLDGHAVDVDGKILMLPEGALEWTVDAGSLGATVNESGVVVVAAAGTVSVTLADPLGSAKATVELSVSKPDTPAPGGQP